MLDFLSYNLDMHVLFFKVEKFKVAARKRVRWKSSAYTAQGFFNKGKTHTLGQSYRYWGEDQGGSRVDQVYLLRF